MLDEIEIPITKQREYALELQRGITKRIIDVVLFYQHLSL